MNNKRAKFNASDFARRHQLGDPVAATFFYCDAPLHPEPAAATE